MSSSTGRQPPGEPGPAGQHAPGDRGSGTPARPGGNGLATASLALGAVGFSLVTVVPSVVFGIFGLRRARAAAGAGKLRCWLGMAFCVLWVGVGWFMVPHLIRAADPGCTAYKGPALTAYQKVIADFRASGRSALVPDLTRAVGTLRAAALRSHNATASRDLLRLTAQLRAVRGDVQVGRVIPASALRLLNRDAASIDAACGTLRL